MTSTLTLVRKSLGTQIREALDASGRDWFAGSAADGRLVYTVEGETFSPGEIADVLGIEF